MTAYSDNKSYKQGVLMEECNSHFSQSLLEQKLNTQASKLQQTC